MAMRKFTVVFLLLVLFLANGLSLAKATDDGFPFPVEPGSITLSHTGIEWSVQGLENNLPMWQELERRTGVKVEWDIIPIEEFNTSMQTRIASGQKLSDIILIPQLWESDTMTYVREDILIPLDELIEQYAPNIQRMWEEYPTIKTLMTAPDGHIYDIPRAEIDIYAYHASLPLIRTDWLETLGLAMPKTIDEWYNVFKQFKEGDPNGNGIADEIPLYMANTGSVAFLGSAFGLHSFGFGLDDDRQVVYNPVTDAYRETLAFLNKLYEEGLMEVEFSSKDQREELAAQNIMGCMQYWSDVIDRWNKYLEEQNIEGGHYTMTLPPANPNGEIKIPQHGSTRGLSYGITKYCENPEIAIKWIDYYYASEEGQLLQNGGLEGVTYNLVDGKPVYTDFVLNNPDGLEPVIVLRQMGAMSPVLSFDKAEFYIQLYSQEYRDFAEVLTPHIVPGYPNVLLTPEESERRASIRADMDTYVQEKTMNFILGRDSLDNFDDFVKQVYEMGLDELLKIEQAKIDRTMN